jgi:hypothetical protein
MFNFYLNFSCKLLFSLFSTAIRTEDLAFARQALLFHTPSPFCFGYFSYSVPRLWPGPTHSYLFFLCSWCDRHMPPHAGFIGWHHQTGPLSSLSHPRLINSFSLISPENFSVLSCVCISKPRWEIFQFCLLIYLRGRIHLRKWAKKIIGFFCCNLLSVTFSSF